MERTNRKKIAISVMISVLVFALMMFVGLTASVSKGGHVADADGAHTHDGITFTAWEGTTSLPSTAGSYYLTADVTLGGNWTVPGTTNLCLNGYGIKTTSGRVIYINGGTLNLYDCGTTTHYFDVNNYLAQNVNDTSGTHSFTGGYITGGRGSNSGCSQTSLYWSEGGGVLVWSGTFNMYGGTILGNSAAHGGGVEVVNGTMNMYGGSIIYNTCDQGGSGINLRSQSDNTATLNMYDGEVCYNRGTAIDSNYNYGNISFTLSGGSISHNSGTGIWIGTFKISGEPIIEDNGGRGMYVSTSTTIQGKPVIRNNGKGDLYVANNNTITITGTWESDPMSVVMASKTGTFTSGWSTHMVDADPADYFTSSDYCLGSSNGEGALFDHLYNDQAHSSEYYTCSICGHVDTARQASMHTFDAHWTYDSVSHWHECTYDGCEERKDEAAHIFGDDPHTSDYYTCSVCGHVDADRYADRHEFDTETWTYDDENHWHKCLYDGCETRDDETAHSFGNDPNTSEYYICSVCGYEDADRQVDYVETVIDKIPDPIQYTPECEDAIDTARNEYDSIPEDKKEGVENRQKLFDAEETYANLRDFQWTIKITPKATVPTEYAAYVAEGEKIVRLCDVTLYRIARSGDNANVPVKAQPSDIGKNFTVSVKLTVPADLIGKNFRILHVHAADDYEFVGFTTADNGEYILINDVDRLSDFAFVISESDITPSGQVEDPTVEPEPEITKKDDPTIDNWEITPQGSTEGVAVVLEDTDSQADVSVEVEIKAEISGEVQKTQNSILSTVIKKGDEIAVVYGVKLIRTTVENGIETREEIQPSDIKPGTVVVIKMSIPESLRGKSFMLLHIHSDQDIKEISYTVSEDETTAIVRVDRLSEFVFVNKAGLSVGAIIGIVIGIILGILLLCLLIFFLLKRRKKEENADDNKAVSAAGALAATAVAYGDEESDDGIVVYAKGNYLNIRYNKSFTAKLIQSSDETKGYYGELKNEVLSYTKTKSHVSWAYDSVNAGREHIVKFGIRGKTLCVYFPLNVEDLDEKYKVEKVDAAKYATVPCLYRIKNERRLRYAKELIEKVCLSIGIIKGEAQNEDYYLPYETNEALIAKGLIKELTVKATATQIERAKQEGSIRVVDNVSASDVNAMISHEVALAAIIKTERHATGKKGIINVDTLSLNFNDGDTITVQGLKEKKLIAPDVKQVKLLARGNLDKVLHVELQDYSIEAVKMILATGGTVKRC